MRPLKRWRIALLLAAAAVFSARADDAVYKCKGNVFQDHPCNGAIPASTAPSTAPPRPAYDARALERELDRLQALGVGMIQRTLPVAQPPRAAPAPKTHDFFKPQPRLSHMQREARDRAMTARLQAQAEHNNAVSAAQLGQIIERQQQQCGGELAELPTVGMSDETFRECTMLARFGETNQIVVSQAGGVALRLYVFPTAKLRRVYSIGGVVTAIKP
jgi:hypothetical protein